MGNTKYDVYSNEGILLGQRARREHAIKLGEKSGAAFEVRTTSGATVHTHTSPTATEEAPVSTDTTTEPETTTEDPGTELQFEGLGMYYAKSAGLHGAERLGEVFGVTATLSGTVLTLHGQDEDVRQVSDHLRSLWAKAKPLHRQWRKDDKVYSGLDKSRKNKEANVERLAMENAWFTAFMDGAADAIAGSPKRKSGAYKTGVAAATEDDGADVL